MRTTLQIYVPKMYVGFEAQVAKWFSCSSIDENIKMDTPDLREGGPSQRDREQNASAVERTSLIESGLYIRKPCEVRQGRHAEWLIIQDFF